MLKLGGTDLPADGRDIPCRRSGARRTFRRPVLARLLSAVLGAAAASPIAAATLATPSVRIVFPNSDTILYGTMPIRVEAAPGIHFRIVEPMPDDRFFTIFDSGQAAPPEHRWLEDLKPHKLLAQVRQEGGWVTVDEEETAGFARPDAWVRDTPDRGSVTEIEIGSHPPLEEVLPELRSSSPEPFFDCTVGGQGCRVTRLVRLREGGALYVTLLVDVSASMKQSAPWKIFKSLEAFVAAMQRQPFKTYVRVVSFSGLSTDLTRGYTDSLDEIRAAVAYLSFAGDETHIYAAVLRELRRISARRAATVVAGKLAQFALVVWSDGRTWGNDIEENRALEWIAKAKAPIFPIVEGDAPGTFGSLASASGGRLFDAGTMDPAKIFGEEIASMLSTRYRVRLETSGRRPTGVLTMSVRGREGVRLFHQDALSREPGVLSTVKQILDRSRDLEELESAALVLGQETTVAAGEELRSILARSIAWNFSLAVCSGPMRAGESGLGRGGVPVEACGREREIAKAIENSTAKCASLSDPLVPASALAGCFGALDRWASDRTGAVDPRYSEQYERFRSAVFASLEGMTGRVLLWSGDARLQRRWLAFLETLVEEGFPVCADVRPFLNLYAWPGFPADPDAKQRAHALCPAGDRSPGARLESADALSALRPSP